MQNAKTHALREQIAKLVDEYAAIALAPPLFLPGISVVPPSGKVIGAEELKKYGRSIARWLVDHRADLMQILKKNWPNSSELNI